MALLPATHSAMKLSSELLKAGLTEMSFRAATGYYHDYLSPLATPCIQLALDLQAAGTRSALNLLRRHNAGEFDATLAESEEWAESEDGRAAFSALLQPQQCATPKETKQ